MTKQEFIDNYCNSNDGKSAFNNKLIVCLPCSCGQGNCKGWAMVSNNELSIKAHNKLYSQEKPSSTGE
jgi:hypothetical protein